MASAVFQMRMDEELKNKILNWQHEFLEKAASEDLGKSLANSCINS